MHRGGRRVLSIVRYGFWAMSWAVALATSSFPAWSQTRHPLGLPDLFAMKRISSPAVSPNGKWVAYTLTTPDLEANGSWSDIWISSIDGKLTRRLTNNAASDRNPAWSPDGRTIAFESSRSGQSQIWILELAGGDPRQFTTLSTGASAAVWSHGGATIAFVSEVFPEFSSRPFSTSDSLNRKKLEARAQSKVKAQVFTRLMYRHWDSWVEGKRKHIFIQSINGGDPRDLTPGDRDAVPTASTFSGGIDFSFSPDDREIAYTASTDPSREEAWRANYDIMTVPVDGGTATQITTNPAADATPRYSSDGKFIAYRAQSRAGFEADRWQLMLYDRATGTVRSLTESFDGWAGTACWSPDGRSIFFESQERTENPIFAVSLKGNDVRKVVDRNSNHDVQISSDGKTLVFTHVSAVRPTEIYSCRTDGSGVIPVTHVNDDLFASLDIPSPESILYEGDGGTRVQAWIFKPPHFDPGKKYPLVYLVHGGPQGAWVNGWSYRWNPPLWAAQGYIVMAPNPRGSTGFGQQFTDEISRDWGGKVFVDLVKGLDYAEQLPYVDRERKAAAGASFGGYMINWFQAKIPERFKTLVCHDGTFNAISNYGTTEELWFDEWEHGGTPWENPEGYGRFSPHLYARNFKTPQLVIHGALDFRISETEAMQMFTALQRRGIPSKFLYFPDEGHWVLKPQNSELWHKTVFAWLAEYLRP